MVGSSLSILCLKTSLSGKATSYNGAMPSLMWTNKGFTWNLVPRLTYPYSYHQEWDSEDAWFFELHIWPSSGPLARYRLWGRIAWSRSASISGLNAKKYQRTFDSLKNLCVSCLKNGLPKKWLPKVPTGWVNMTMFNMPGGRGMA